MTTATEQSSPWIRRYYSLALSPWSIIACVLAGAAFGNAYPLIAQSGVPRQDVDLLKMIVLPVLHGGRHRLQPAEADARGDTSRIMGRVFWGVLIFFGTVAVTAIVTLVMHPGVR